MHILQVCSSLAWGGTEMHVPILTAKLEERGHAVQIMAHPKGSILPEAASRGLTALPLPLGRYVDPATTARLIRRLKRQRPDIIHLHLSRDLWQTVPAALMAGNPALILTKHVGSYVRKFDLLHRWLYRQVDCVITVSDVLHKNVRETCPVRPEQVITIHHALDLGKYDPERFDRQAIRQSLHIPADALVVGAVGRISPGKGYEDFLQAAQRIVSRNPGRAVVFLIVGAASFGEEAYYTRIRDMAKTLGLEERVVFTGFRADVPALLTAMDLFVFPSRAEGFGATLIEAMAMRVACVSTLSDGTLDIVAPDRTGLTYAPGDVEGLVKAVSTLIEDSERRERIARAGQEHARRHFDLDRMTERIEQVYADALRARRSTAG